MRKTKPKPVKYPVAEILRLACLYAEQDRESLIDAYGDDLDDPVVLETKNFLRQLRSYRKSRWGQTSFEALVENSKSIDLATVAGRKTIFGCETKN